MHEKWVTNVECRLTLVYSLEDRNLLIYHHILLLLLISAKANLLLDRLSLIVKDHSTFIMPLLPVQRLYNPKVEGFIKMYQTLNFIVIKASFILNPVMYLVFYIGVG